MIVRVVSAAALFLSATPALAQSLNKSESYEFVDAVRKKDGTKVNAVLEDASSNVLNTKDPYTGEGALHVIAKARDITYLSVFLNRPRIDINLQDRQGNTPLLIAVEAGWVEGVAQLIRRKANVNLANSAGETPLIRAVLIHDADLVRMLLDAGANPDKADFHAGLSAREYAARDTRYTQIAKLLADAPKNGKAALPAAGPRL
jgi:uncharacterized protein